LTVFSPTPSVDALHQLFPDTTALDLRSQVSPAASPPARVAAALREPRRREGGCRRFESRRESNRAAVVRVAPRVMNRCLLLPLLLATLPMSAAPRPAQLDESPVPPYSLPDPLVRGDGAAVRDPAGWEVRRAELLELFAREVYGRTLLGRPPETHVTQISVERGAFRGLATRQQVRIEFGRAPGAPAMELLVYIPAAAPQPVPAFLGLNFYGNHTVAADPGIRLPTGWISPDAPAAVANRATEAARGTDAGKWPVELLLRRGYAVATVYCGDLCPDRADGLAAGVNGWFFHTTTESRAADAWGAIGVWAWGLSRALDFLETQPAIDASRVAVHGHSRLGKAALWAAAQDPRFALAISNESGCGGAALSKRIHGETVAKINAVFPHWFARNFREYNDREPALPVDQHELLALVAPRPLYVASAEGDDWADPRGEFLAVQGAVPVYRLLGRRAAGVEQLPPVNAPAGDVLRYHIRPGPHDLTEYDWLQYAAFTDEWLPRR
jgi:hypothetical protein